MQQKFVEVEYLDNNRIHVIHLNDVSRASVDHYMQFIESEIIEMEGSLLLSVHNYSNLGGTITPYFLGRAKQITSTNIRTDMIGRVAMVTSMDIFRLIINPIMSRLMRENNKVKIRFFSNVEEAVSWVSEYQE